MQLIRLIPKNAKAAGLLARNGGEKWELLGTTTEPPAYSDTYGVWGHICPMGASEPKLWVHMSEDRLFNVEYINE
jgi:hypothetical protein